LKLQRFESFKSFQTVHDFKAVSAFKALGASNSFRSCKTFQGCKAGVQSFFEAFIVLKLETYHIFQGLDAETLKASRKL